MQKKINLNIINMAKEMHNSSNESYKHIAKKLSISKNLAKNANKNTARYLTNNIFTEKRNFPYIDQLTKYINQRLKDKQALSLGICYKLFVKDKILDISKNAFKEIYSTAFKYAKNEKLLFVPIMHIPGVVELDFGYCDIKLDECLTNVFFMVICMPYSNYKLTQILEVKNSISVTRALDRMFSFLNAYPAKLSCDNDVAIIRKEIPIPVFENYCSTNNIELHFCNVNRPNEKIHVENSIRNVRRNLLTPVPEITDLDKYNRDILFLCKAVNNNVDMLAFKKDINACSTYDPNKPIAQTQIKLDELGQLHLDKTFYYFDATLAYKNVTLFLTIDSFFVKDKEKVFTLKKHLSQTTDLTLYLKLLLLNLNCIHSTVFFQNLSSICQKNILKMNIKERYSFVSNLLTKKPFNCFQDLIDYIELQL